MVYQIDPLEDPRWPEFLLRQRNASVFHSRGWLEALRGTYGYDPIAITTSPPRAELESGIVLCRVNSWLTGRRLVSLPFADHCDFLVGHPGQLGEMLDWLVRERPRCGWKYVDIRPKPTTFRNGHRWALHKQFCLHLLDLGPSVEVLFSRLHKSSTQAKIRRAERHDLLYEEGRTEALLRKFYGLLRQTRRRHRLPPQPYEWFGNLIHWMGDALKIRVASKQGRPIAGILTLRYKNTMVYKYGGSDARFHNFGGMQLLFWRTILEAKLNGCEELDLGRSDLDNAGLMMFKDRWGAARVPLSYWRLPGHIRNPSRTRWSRNLAKRILGWAPDFVVDAAGRLIYRHIA